MSIHILEMCRCLILTLLIAGGSLYGEKRVLSVIHRVPANNNRPCMSVGSAAMAPVAVACRAVAVAENKTGEAFCSPG